MGTNNIEAARTAFSKFEKNITNPGAIGDLREGMDYALDCIDDIHSDAQSARAAKNIIHTYRQFLLGKISVELDDTGSFGVDYYSHWISLVCVFLDAGYDEDKRLSEVRLGLLKKSYETLSKEEQSELLRALQRDVDGK
ncbi:MAG: hypothetical protein O6924_09385, partial [Alphaproteobacteria bacterium]|nr:hypothetical protein [Alphaproteobacteria bacterium]